MTQVKEPVILDKTGERIAEGVAAIVRALSRDSYTCYAFHINGNESDPASMVTYLKDAEGLTPASMNFSAGSFSWGSWRDAFFIPRPCMLLQTGSVDYYLDEDNYALKADGVTASDIENTAYAGNAMMEWGRNGKKIWYKIVPDSGDDSSATVYIADEQLDDSYHDWSFINNQGKQVDHFYTPIFNGSVIDNVMRSLSGQTVSKSLNGSTELTYAKANNKDSNMCWNTEVFADRILLTLLGVLMFKTTDIPTALGQGIISGGETAFNNYKTGALNTAGLFYGYNDTVHAVKFFGMENFWGLQWRRTAGLMNVSGAIKYKLTNGTEDGSTATAYNTTGDGYINAGATMSGTSGGYISKMKYLASVFIAEVMSGSSSTYYCDGGWFNNGQTDYALFGGGAAIGVRCGPFAVNLGDAVGTAWGSTGAAVSFKPLA